MNVEQLTAARDYLAKIPEELWCTNTISEYEKKCAIGHLLEQNNPLLTELLNLKSSTGGFLITQVNDRPSPAYPQRTPKRRVLAFFEDLISKEKFRETPPD